MIYRNITKSITDALKDSPVVFLNGARQTGKSTLVKWLAENKYSARYLSLDDAAVLNAALNDPDGFINGLEGNVIFDEVQKAPELFRALKIEVDKNRIPGRYLLTGSANVLLLPSLSEYLAGRIEIHTLRPFSQGEIEGIEENFIDSVFKKKTIPLKSITEKRSDLIKRILSGGYPEVLKRPSAGRRKAWFGSYIATILQRDIRDLSRIEGLTALPRLLSLIATRNATLLNFAELSRSSGLPQTTLKRYISLLETTFLIYFLPAWHINLSKRLTKAPKVYISDTGICAYLAGIRDERSISEMHSIGHLMENFAVTELLRQLEWSDISPRLFHFRTVTGNEIDIIMEDSSGRVVGIEIKAGTTLNKNDFKSLQFLADNIGGKFHRGIILYTGSESIPFGKNMFALPIQYIWESGNKNRKE